MALQLSQTLNTERLARTAATPGTGCSTASRPAHGGLRGALWRDVTRTVLIGEKDKAAIAAACRSEGLPEIDNVVWGRTGRRRAVQAAAGSRGGGHGHHVGGDALRPNVEAALWFTREVWPLVGCCGLRPASSWSGATRPLPSRPWTARITVTGTVEEPADWIARAAVCVAPIRAAAGLQNKLLEAMAMAKAVVAMPEANEGIGAPVDEALLLAREPGSFAQAVLSLLADPARRDRLGKAARAFVEAKWTWEGPFLELEQAFLAAVEAGLGARATAPSPVPRPASATA